MTIVKIRRLINYGNTLLTQLIVFTYQIKFTLPRIGKRRCPFMQLMEMIRTWNIKSISLYYVNIMTATHILDGACMVFKISPVLMSLANPILARPDYIICRVYMFAWWLLIMLRIKGREATERRASIGYDDVMKWKHIPRYWPFVRGINQSPSNSTHKGQWRGALMFSLMIYGCTNGCENNWDAVDVRRHCTHYDVTVVVTYDTTIASPYEYFGVSFRSSLAVHSSLAELLDRMYCTSHVTITPQYIYVTFRT